ncbi:LCP family protein [Rugosimonospora acidiphila]|uniref:LCP family protein n=1 Tax=Rugosimonospora acidiphila TaxID=556531 RepID=UPI0031E6DC08
MDDTSPAWQDRGRHHQGRHHQGRHRVTRETRANLPEPVGHWKRALVVLLSLLLLFCGGLATTGYLLMHHYEGRVSREDLLGPARRPGTDGQPDSGPLNLLLLGSDSRAGEPDQDEYPGQRSDAVMLIHVNRDRDEAAVISIPRDSYVYVPASGSDWSGGMNKLNAALALGGAPLAAQTVTRLTGVQLNGALIATFSATREMVDAVGGVDVCLPYTVTSTDTKRVWPEGCHHLNGDEADDLARQRHDLPDADLSRIHDQQLIIQAIARKVTTGKLLTNPLQLSKLVSTAAGALVVDKDLDLTKLALALRKIKPANVRYATVPYSNLDLQTPQGSAVELDEAKSKALFAAVRDDTVTGMLSTNP